MTNDNEARGALTDERAQTLWDEACKDGRGRPGWSRHLRFAKAVAHEAIASFLDRTGQYVTNDASREAAIADALSDRLPAGDGLTGAQQVALMWAANTADNQGLDLHASELRAILAAPQRQTAGDGLTDVQIDAILEHAESSLGMGRTGWGYIDARNIARAILALPRQPGEVDAGVPDTFARAKAIVETWPGWKRDFTLTPYSASAQQDEREADLLVKLDDAKRAIHFWKTQYQNLANVQQVHADAGAVAYIPDDALARLTPPLLVLDGVRLYRYNGVGTTALYLRPAAESDKRDAS
ncbi:hypothetical protein [Cupriavidus sp. DL-D2]|uniref:hypothetical protein n=1 Tax=Cupriavidus sp. DL-D2 TaxID=3144974 RepID=UPI003212FA9C